MKMYIENFCDVLRDDESHWVTWNNMLNTVTATEIGLFSLLHLFLKARHQLWPPVYVVPMRRPRSVKGYHFYHSGWNLSPSRRLRTMVTMLVRVRRLRVVPALASPPAKTPLVHQKLQALQLTVQRSILLCGWVEGSALLTCRRGEEEHVRPATREQMHCLVCPVLNNSVFFVRIKTKREAGSVHRVFTQDFNDTARQIFDKWE